jgi:hypothetical protein
MTPTATLALDRTTVSLSESVRATVVIEGASPLVVAAPQELLASEAAAAWRVRPVGPAAVEELPNGRERWVQEYRLDPYIPGESVPVAFAPIEAASGGGLSIRVETAPQTVRVQTAIKQPKPEDARPVTGIEVLPPAPAPHLWSFALAVALGVAVVLAVMVVLLRSRRKAPPLTPAEWANSELANLEQNLNTDMTITATFADRLAEIIRIFVARQYGVPATRFTTAELAAAEPLLPGDIIPLLVRCDLAKFAGQPPTPVECWELLTRTRAIVAAEADADVRT